MDIDPSDPDANGDVSSDCNGNFSPDECDLPHILTMLSTESENLSENFGGNVAIDGEYAFAGATGDEENGPDSGRVHVFHYDGVNWMPMQNLSASDAASGFYFGTAISVADDTAFIGASSATSGNGSFGGAVYVFKVNGGVWQETAKLTASDAQNGDSFGICLSLSDDVLAIAATRDDDLGNDSGSAYLFQRIEDAWVQVAKIKPNDGAAGDGFGQGISISDGVLAVGAPYDDDLGNGSGSVYVFEQVLGVWQQTAKIIPFNGKSFDNFGASIGLHSGGLLVGSPGDDDASAEAGAVFIYQENTTGWQQVEKLAAQPSRPGSRLGNSITCSAGLSLIGASSENVQGQASARLTCLACPGKHGTKLR
ncbi:MAG: hypothetical protein IPK83_22975 [Planctomycetes bacterium]|nr:hypothetical protein [Planctomycetota bacterium]